MRTFISSLLLLLPLVVNAQHVIGKPYRVGVTYSEKEKQAARDILANNQNLILPPGQFELIVPDPTAVPKGPLSYFSISNKTYYLHQVDAGKDFGWVGTRRGETERKKHIFEAKPYPWAVIEAAEYSEANKSIAEETILVTRNGAPPEKYGPVEVDRVVISRGEKPPPGPPGPTPPTPTPSDAPIPVDGFRVMVVYDKRQTLPSEQIAAINSRDFRSYLDAKCVKVDSQSEWRVFSTTTNVQGDSEIWRNAYARPRRTTPWILISTGKTGIETELPENFDKLMELVKKYGGP